jgi:hypothetical protein
VGLLLGSTSHNCLLLPKCNEIEKRGNWIQFCHYSGFVEPISNHDFSEKKQLFVYTWGGCLSIFFYLRLCRRFIDKSQRIEDSRDEAPSEKKCAGCVF